MLIIVEKDSEQSNDSAKNGTRKRSDTLPSARYFNMYVHIRASAIVWRYPIGSVSSARQTVRFTQVTTFFR